MSAPSTNVTGPPLGRTFVAYKDPSGGLNTKRDAHALDRNMAATSINFWPAYDNALAKRPGSNFAISSNGVTGMGGTGTTIVATRWIVSGVSTTVLLAQNGVKLAFAAVGASSWTAISTSMGTGALRIHVAQMYDVLSGKNQCFICNGVDLPWLWAGPGNTTMTQTSTANGLPENMSGSAGITPRFVETFNGSLIYSGEPTSPTAVYISDAWKPQSFTQNSATTTVYNGGSGYQPYLIGFQDGIAGGNVTGLGFLNGSILVFKESAIYRGTFADIYGQVYAEEWQCISPSRGFIAPESIVAFDTFICGLSIDGTYWTDGYQMVQFSSDVPTFFDGSLNGYGPICLAYTTAVGARCGQRYLIAYDRGVPSAPGASVGYPTSGLWFDFSRTTQSGQPEAGEFQGTTSAAGTSWAIGGMCSLSGPNDTGLVAWTDPTQDRAAIFGRGFSDLGNAIAVTFAGPADFIPEAANPSPEAAGISPKTVHRAFLNVAIAVGSQLTFSCQLVTDLLSATITTGVSPPSMAGSLIWGSGSWGTGTWGTAANQTTYSAIGLAPASTADGRVIQMVIGESSTSEWILLGYTLEVSARMPNL